MLTSSKIIMVIHAPQKINFCPFDSDALFVNLLQLDSNKTKTFEMEYSGSSLPAQTKDMSWDIADSHFNWVASRTTAPCYSGLKKFFPIQSKCTTSQNCKTGKMNNPRSMCLPSGWLYNIQAQRRRCKDNSDNYGKLPLKFLYLLSLSHSASL